MLIRPVSTWNGITENNRSVAMVLLIFLLPLLLLTSVLEGYGLVHFGKYQSVPMSVLKKYTVQEAVVFETGHTMLLAAAVFIIATAARAFSQTFHTRNNFQQAFNAVAYGFAPLLSLRLLDGLSSINGWVAWGIGLALTLAVLYHGLPCILRPDPPHAFGLYFNTCVTVIVATGLLRLVVVYLWEGRLKGLSELISSAAAKLPS